ncbi:MAG TPA: single-stranded-DNA-specific exonuclease RecJ [Gemmatimonadota bacterium]|nr:single-stranded-DNA-specific exonuclease RecJ [Gemmatimonadota bacterium]
MLRPTWTWPTPVDGLAASALASELGVPAAVAELLLRRGFDTPDRARAFLDPTLDQLHDPFEMRDMDLAVARVEAALASSEKIVVYGDYDVDGITATALLVRYLRWRGADVQYYIPHRVEDGYGLSKDGVTGLAERGARLVITCDCGVTAVEEVALARDMGLDVIVTDHHECGADLPPGIAVLDPKREDCAYPDQNLAAVGVAFKLCEALEISAGRDRGTLRRGLDLVALGTIADLVPVTGENRVLIRFGLDVLAGTRNAGLKALLQRTELDRCRPSAWQVGFVLAPRINAVGRMDAAVRGVELLLCDEAEKAERIADALEEVNVSRQAADRNLLSEALQIIESSYDPSRDRAIVLAGKDWHPGVIGIVASRVVERFHRPTVMIALDADGRGRGSARSVPGFHLLEALTACAEHLDAYGGHRYAAGLAIRHDRVDAFRAAFQEYASERLDARSLQPSLTIDLELPLEAIDAPLYSALGRFGPYGPGNPEPVMALTEVSARGYPRIVGDDHLKILVARNGRTLDTIGFHMGQLMQEMDLNRGPLTIACRLRENTYLGRSALQGRLIDVLPGNGRS